MSRLVRRRDVLFLLLLGGKIFFCALIEAQTPASPLAVLTSVEQVRRLDATAAAKGHPIRFEGIVTYNDPAGGILFIQDPTGGIFVAPEKGRDLLRPRHRVRVQGVVEAGSRLPFVSNASVEILDRDDFPVARQPAAGKIADGTEDAQWLEVRGTLRAMDPEMEMVVQGERLKLWVSGDISSANMALLLPGARLRVRGVGGLDTRGNEILSGALFVPGEAELQVERPAPASPFDLPLSSAAALATNRALAGELVRARGFLRGTTADGLLSLEDDTGSFRVKSAKRALAQRGEMLEVAGFCDSSTAVPLLDDVLIRVSAPSRGAAARGAGQTPRVEDFLPVLGSAAEVRELSLPALTNGYPVRFRATVTFVETNWPALFVQDATAGVYIYLPTNSAPLRMGELVQVEGFAAAGRFAPIVMDARVRSLGPGEMPRPRVVGYEALLGGSFDSQWLEIAGVVSQVIRAEEEYWLEVRSGTGTFMAGVGKTAGPPPPNLLDARVRLRGVCGTRYTDTKQFVGINFLLPGWDQVIVEDAAPGDPFLGSLQSTVEVLQFKPPGSGFGRSLVRGAVTYVASAGDFILQDAVGALRVRLRQPAEVAVGDNVEVAGYPALVAQAPVLRDAVSRVVGASPLPAPVDLLGCLGAAQDRGLPCQNLRVSAEGFLIQRVEMPGHWLFTLQAGREVITVRLSEVSAASRRVAPAVGSRLSVTGVCSVRADDWGRPLGISLLTRSPLDVVVLSRPSWWTVGRLGFALGLALVAIGAGLLITVALRRRVAEQTAHIRERLEREAALEARYRDLVENASDVIFTTDTEGRFTSVNHALERLLGYSSEEAVRLYLAGVVTPESAPAVRDLLAGKQPGAGTLDLLIRSRAGRNLVLQVSPRQLSAAGQPPGFQCIGREVTEQRRAEQSARLVEQLYRQAIAVADAVPYQLDYATNKYTFIGELVREISGFSAAELTPAVWDSLVQEVRMRGEAAGLSVGEATRLIKAGKIKRWVNDTRIITRSGETRWVSDSAIQIMDEHGVATGSIGILQDVTERKRVEQELRRNEARFRSVVESNLIGMAFWRADGSLSAVNKRFAETLGYPPEEMVSGSLSWPALSPPGHSAADEKAFRELADVGYCSPYEKELVRRDGSRVPVLVGATYLESSRLEAVSFVLDISSRLNLETQLRHAQKLEGVGRLAGGVAHDFNNLLTVILGHCNLLRMTAPGDSATAESIQEIQASATRAANLTRQLLTFSRKQVVQSRDVDLNEVVAQVSNLLTRLLGEDVTLHCNYSPQLLMVHADPGMLEQVLMNLAVNARDAMPKGGRLVIEVNAVERAAGPAEGAAGRAGRFACLTVTDTGAGMDDATLSHIFEPFFTTKEVGKGTGLGLATVYGIVEMHAGWIEVSTQVGVGTSFRVYFPALSGAVNPAPRSASKPEAPRGRGETILVVEDEPALRHLILRSLERHGYKVISAASGPQALEQWRAHEGKVDLLLTDMVMPDGMTGRELAQKLREQRPDLRTIFSSGYSVELSSQEGELIEGFNFLAKPYQPAALARAVRSRLDA